MAQAKDVAPAGGSASFTDTSKNRNSLTVVPSRQPDAACLHKAVRDELQRLLTRWEELFEAAQA